MRLIKNILFSTIITLSFFILLELASRLFVFPGSYDYIERRIIEQGLTQNKSKGEFRIFLYGESTMQGSHLYPYSTIDKWLRLYIDDLLPEDVSKKVRIINFARLGAGSKFVSSSFIETAPYRPDLAVFYTAHNDFYLPVNRREYLYKRPLKEKLEDFTEALPKHSAFMNAVNRVIIKAKLARNRIRDEKLSRMDNWYMGEDDRPPIPSSDLLYPDSREFYIIKKGFEGNVKRAARFARQRSIPLIFLEGVARYKGYEPVKSAHSPSLARETLLAWTRLYSEAGNAFKSKKYQDAIGLYGRCIELDLLYALTYYRIGECYEGLNEFNKANEFYSLANDKDCYPIRAPSVVNRFYENMRADGAKGIYIIQTQKLFEERSQNGIIDENLIGDQIHPTVEGQALIALEIVKLIYDKELLAPKARWRWGHVRGVEEMKRSLALDNNAEFEICLALAGYLNRHYTKATEFLEKALKIKPDSILAKSWLAWAYWKTVRRDEALALYRELSRRRPDLAAEFFGRHPDIKEMLGKSLDGNSV